MIEAIAQRMAGIVTLRQNSVLRSNVGRETLQLSLRRAYDCGMRDLAGNELQNCQDTAAAIPLDTSLPYFWNGSLKETSVDRFRDEQLHVDFPYVIPILQCMS